jgi:RND family efflux transporter MFP subunit
MTAALRLTAALLAGLTVSACQEKAVEAMLPRPVRAEIVQHTADVDPIELTGVIESKDQVDLAFRIGGILEERRVSVGDRVAVGDTVARLRQDAVQNGLRAAQAKRSAAQANLTQAESDMSRQKQLAAGGVVSQARIELAQQAEQSARASVNEAEAQLQTAMDNIGYTELKAEAAGSVTSVAADTGEVVSPGQWIVRLALDSGKDAVFNVPLKLIRDGRKDAPVTVMLADDTGITATGGVREVAPQANAVTGTYEVKVGLQDPPETMRLGATVIGRVSLSSDPVVVLPGSALTKVGSEADVWVVDPAAKTVAARPVGVRRYDGDSVVVDSGLADGDIVVTAGVHALRPGQEVRLLDPGR